MYSNTGHENFITVTRLLRVLLGPYLKIDHISHVRILNRIYRPYGDNMTRRPFKVDNNLRRRHRRLHLDHRTLFNKGLFPTRTTGTSHHHPPRTRNGITHYHVRRRKRYPKITGRHRNASNPDPDPVIVTIGILR